MTRLLINDIKCGLDEDVSTAYSKAKKALKSSGVSPTSFKFSVYRRSVDARNKSNIVFVYSILAESDAKVIIRGNSNIKELQPSQLEVTYGIEHLPERPLVVGMGPAGLFCALILAENGYNPILIDRGDSVSDRIRAIEGFMQTGNLDTESNIQFGAGGAGTFSDGKLTTRINDSKCSYVLSRFVEFGAPEEILTRAKPHIGTDILVSVIDNMLNKISELGGTVMYRTRMDDITALGNTISIATTKGKINAGVVVLALGHSARDTYKMLLSKNFVIEPKPFSVGVRVEHLQSDIDNALYGDFAGHPKLGPAEYNLSDTKGGRGVYTFCMCPGGEVVPATSQECGVCVNGMSRYARNGKNANCAVNVSINTDDYCNDPHKAIEFQTSLENKAFIAGGSNYSAPVQTMGDFLEDKLQNIPTRVLPTYAYGTKVKVTSLSEILPDYVTKRLKEGFVVFDRKIKGFAVRDAVLTGVETRTSAPVRIMRTPELHAISNPLVYPCGEGAGYAGGIMSSAVDGIKVALQIMSKYKSE